MPETQLDAMYSPLVLLAHAGAVEDTLPAAIAARKLCRVSSSASYQGKSANLLRERFSVPLILEKKWSRTPMKSTFTASIPALLSHVLA